MVESAAAHRPPVIFVVPGVGLLIVATIGLLIGSAAPLVGGFGVLGVGCLVIGYLGPRLRGPIIISWSKIELNVGEIARDVTQAEKDVTSGKNLTPLEALKDKK